MLFRRHKVGFYPSQSPCSHGGNTLFPGWELFRKQFLQEESCSVSSENNSFHQKSLHPSRQWAGTPLNKGFLDFHPSLDPSPHLSHNPPVDSSLDGRDKGGLWEGLKTSLPYSNPFVHGLSERFREG